MKLPRRNFLHLAASAAALPFAPHVARAQTYPTRPVRIIDGFAAGGPADIVARLIAQWLSERLGQPFVIENRPGAAGNIGTEAVVRAPADGYTLLLAATPAAINATLYEKLNFNFIRDIVPVASLIRAPSVLEVNPSVLAKTVPEFIAYAKANPGKLTMASGGIGAATHLAGELFKVMTSVDIRPGSNPCCCQQASGYQECASVGMAATSAAIISNAPSGHAAAALPPSSVMNSRRFIMSMGTSSPMRYHPVDQIAGRFPAP
jgi:hypothetical protein